METILYDMTIYLLAAVIAVPIAARLGLGSVLGYLAAGILIGPVLGIVGAETEELQHIAEFGVVMMLFLIGLELKPKTLWEMRHRLLGLGGLQILGTMVLIGGGALVLGNPWQTAVAIGMIFALSSTAIVLQTLSEKGLMRTNGGRSTFSVLLTQDIAVIPFLALLPFLAVGSAGFNEDGSIRRAGDEAGSHGGDHAEHALSLVEGLPAWGVALVTLGMVAAVILAGVYLARPVFRFIHQARLREMFTALALLIVVGISLAMTMVGLSPALGSFLAGVVLANSEFRHELETDIEPFKGLLLGLFFITVGAGINFAVLWRAPLLLLFLTACLIVAKFVVLWALALIFRIKGRDRWLFSLGLAQAGEFGFVLVAFSTQQGVLPSGLSERILLVVALSMLVTPALFIAYEYLSRRLKESGEEHEADEIDEEGPVIIAGVGRFGQIVNRLVSSSGFKTVVLDNDMDTITLMRRFGVKGFFGDPTRPDLLKSAGIDDARVLVVALDDPEAAVTLVRQARKARPDLHIVARARDRTHVFRLYNAGANDIVREMFDSSLRAGRYVLENMGMSDWEANQAETTFYAHDRHAIRELAEVWKDGIPAHRNEEYVKRAKELQKELETALLEALEEERKEAG